MQRLTTALAKDVIAENGKGNLRMLRIMEEYYSPIRTYYSVQVRRKRFGFRYWKTYAKTSRYEDAVRVYNILAKHSARGGEI